MAAVTSCENTLLTKEAYSCSLFHFSLTPEANDEIKWEYEKYNKKITNINNINIEGVLIIIMIMKTNKYKTERCCRH